VHGGSAHDGRGSGMVMAQREGGAPGHGDWRGQVDDLGRDKGVQWPHCHVLRPRGGASGRE
jgi:hypothetical protein